MIWRIEEEDIKVVLKTGTVEGKRKLLASDDGYSIRNVMLMGDTREFSVEHMVEGASLARWNFYAQTTAEYPGEKRVSIILSRIVHSAYRIYGCCY